MKPREFTQEQIEWVRENIPHMSTRECAQAFSEKFPEGLGQTVLRRLMKKNGISARAKENAPTPVGTERYSSYYDCIMVKVSESRVAGIKKDSPEFVRIRNNSWKMKQNLIWEQMTGETIPWRHIVVFLDGDRTNYSPDNLFAVPLQIAGTIERMRMHSENPEIYKTALIWGELFFELKKQGYNIYMDERRNV